MHTQRIALTALFTALISIAALISFPLPIFATSIPFTLQNLIVIVAGLLLAPLDACLAVLGFLLLGALGLPVFAGRVGGLAVLLSPRAGYLIGYLLATIVTSLIVLRASKLHIVFASIIGFAIILFCGALGLVFIAKLDFTKALLVGALPFIIGDSIKIILAIIIGLALKKFMLSIYQK